MQHYLAINHAVWDEDYVYGVFDSFEAASEYLDSREAWQDFNPDLAVVEVWEGRTLVAVYERELDPAPDPYHVRSFRDPRPPWSERKSVGTPE